jgi:GT2 family glycosyltransferase
VAASALAIVIVSHNCAPWLAPCLRSVFAHAGDVPLDVVVIDNASDDDSAELVRREFPQVRVLEGPNRGFAYGNNTGVLATGAPFVLFLNPDTEVIDGTFGELVQALRARPRVGLAGCRQLTPEGDVHPTIRRFPTPMRALFEALGSERFPFRASWLGERELDPARYEQDTACDWTSGSFMAARREALLAAGLMDERFFIYCEEPDLCRRIKGAGWEVRHLPVMTIVHHAGKSGWNARLAAQDAYARRQYVEKHCSRPGARLALAALALGLAVRAALAERQHRAACRAALRTLVGRTPPPFGPPPTTAVADDGRRTAALEARAAAQIVELPRVG